MNNQTDVSNWIIFKEYSKILVKQGIRSGYVMFSLYFVVFSSFFVYYLLIPIKPIYPIPDSTIVENLLDSINKSSKNKLINHYRFSPDDNITRGFVKQYNFSEEDYTLISNENQFFEGLMEMNYNDAIFSIEVYNESNYFRVKIASNDTRINSLSQFLFNIANASLQKFEIIKTKFEHGNLDIDLKYTVLWAYMFLPHLVFIFSGRFHRDNQIMENLLIEYRFIRISNLSFFFISILYHSIALVPIILVFCFSLGQDAYIIIKLFISHILLALNLFFILTYIMTSKIILFIIPLWTYISIFYYPYAFRNHSVFVFMMVLFPFFPFLSLCVSIITNRKYEYMRSINNNLKLFPYTHFQIIGFQLLQFFVGTLLLYTCEFFFPHYYSRIYSDPGSDKKDNTLEYLPNEDRNLIFIDDVHKFFQTNELRVALDGISGSIRQCEVIALIGPNGCGKSTLCKCLNGLIHLDKGRIIYNCLFGESQNQYPIFGYMEQESKFLDSLSVFEHLEFFGKTKGIAFLEDRINEISDLLGISDLLTIMASNLSKGELKKMNFALALLHSPNLLLLDEPTVGLDVESRKTFYKIVSSLEGVTTLIFSHSLEESENVCSRIFLMQGGKFIYYGTPSEIRIQTQCGYFLYADSSIINPILSIIQADIPEAYIQADGQNRIMFPNDSRVTQAIERLDASQIGPYTLFVEDFGDKILKFVEESEF